MSKNEIREKVLDVFAKTGYLIDDYNLELSDYIPDSLAFMTIIVELEDVFGIVFPDESININTLSSIEVLTNLIEELC